MKVLLVYASSQMEIDESINTEATVVPMNLMAIGAFLEQGRHQVKIIDARIYSRKYFLQLYHQELAWAECVGFSVMTSQIKHARLLSKMAKDFNPKLTVVWGGIHPTLFPEQTCQDEFVDYVIAGEGEYGMDKLLDYLQGKIAGLHGIEGLAHSAKGVLTLNPQIEPIDVERLPRLAYHLVDMERYITRKLLNGKWVRGMDVLTSRGCPYQCAFCVNPFWSYRKWRAISAERALQDIDYLVREYAIEHIWFADDYFFGKKDRAQAIVQGIRSRPYSMSWEANIRVDNFNDKNVDDAFLAMIRDSGCYMLSMGMESASERMLKLMDKGTTPSQILFAVDQCKKYSILPRGYWITGLPDETPEDLKLTLAMNWKIHETQPCDDYYWPSFYHPYPGGKLYAECKKRGFQEPQSLHAWAEADMKYGYLEIRKRPWVKNEKMFVNLISYGRFVQYADYFRWKKKPPLSWLGQAARAWLNVRAKRGFWSFRFELWLTHNPLVRTAWRVAQRLYHRAYPPRPPVLPGKKPGGDSSGAVQS